MNHPDFFEHDATVHAQSLQAFRRRHALRRAALPLALCATVIAIFLNRPTKKQPTITPPVAHAPAHAATVETLTDDQLLALFPSGSCYIAEVNGQKRLLFRDPEAKKQFFGSL